MRPSKLGYLNFRSTSSQLSEVLEVADYLILIEARLYGLVDQVRDLMADKIHKFNLPQLIAIARMIGVTVRL
jgi:hypothetical protein